MKSRKLVTSEVPPFDTFMVEGQPGEGYDVFRITRELVTTFTHSWEAVSAVKWGKLP